MIIKCLVCPQVSELEAMMKHMQKVLEEDPSGEYISYSTHAQGVFTRYTHTGHINIVFNIQN